MQPKSDDILCADCHAIGAAMRDLFSAGERAFLMALVTEGIDATHWAMQQPEHKDVVPKTALSDGLGILYKLLVAYDYPTRIKELGRLKEQGMQFDLQPCQVGDHAKFEMH